MKKTNRKSFLAVAIGVLMSMVATTASAADIVLEASAVQKLVRQSLFKDRGRMMLLRGVCEAYLENPVVSIAAGRVQIASRLAGRVGANAGGSCMGVDVASNTVVSGVPVAAGGVVRLQDIRIVVADPAARSLMDELGLSSLMPTVVDLDVESAVKTMLTQASGDVQATVESFSFQDVSVVGNRLSMTFEFRLLGR